MVANALSRSVKMIHLAAVRTYETDVRERFRNAQETNPFFKTMKSYLKKDPIGLKYEGYHMLDEGLLTYRNRLYVPSCDNLKRFIMDELHKIYCVVPQPIFEETLVVFDHFWDFERLVKDGAPRKSKDHGISPILWDF